MRKLVVPGRRVIVPFGRGNRRCEAMVLSVSKYEGTMQLKPIDSLMDEEPILTEKQLKLALWMRDRFSARYMMPCTPCSHRECGTGMAGRR